MGDNKKLKKNKGEIMQNPEEEAKRLDTARISSRKMSEGQTVRQQGVQPAGGQADKALDCIGYCGWEAKELITVAAGFFQKRLNLKSNKKSTDFLGIRAV
uniref:Uncharacterized protein n=1 Tax=Setaria digitata TaxID=48799 RepID=A0A915PQU6_9BILA